MYIAWCICVCIYLYLLLGMYCIMVLKYLWLPCGVTVPAQNCTASIGYLSVAVLTTGLFKCQDDEISCFPADCMIRIRTDKSYTYTIYIYILYLGLVILQWFVCFWCMHVYTCLRIIFMYPRRDCILTTVFVHSCVYEHTCICAPVVCLFVYFI